MEGKDILILITIFLFWMALYWKRRNEKLEKLLAYYVSDIYECCNCSGQGGWCQCLEVKEVLGLNGTKNSSSGESNGN